MADKRLDVSIQLRSDTEANWLLATEYIPLAGEACVTLDGANKGQVKFGDGEHTWAELSYAGVSKTVAPAQHFTGTASGEQTDNEVLAEITAGKTLTVGDTAVITRVLINDKKSYTAYVYDGEKWAAMDGNYSAENVYFDDNLIITSTVGVHEPDDTGSKEVEVSGMNIAQALAYLFAEESDPTATPPRVTFSTPSGDKSYEYGDVVDIAYAASLSAGSYTYGPATGITATGWSVKDTVGTTKTTASGTFEGVEILNTYTSSAPYIITATATHGAGSVPKTNLGNDYTAAQIAAGSKTGTSKKVYGYRNSFYGAYDNVDTALTDMDSDYIRALTATEKTMANGGTFNVNIPAGTKRAVIAYPASLRAVTSILDSNDSNSNIKGSFILSTVSVEAKNGKYPIDYKVYTMDYAGDGASADNVLKVTI